MKFPLKRAGHSIGSILGLISLIICIIAPCATGISSANKNRFESESLPGNIAAQQAAIPNSNGTQIGEAFDKLPMRFEKNVGQFGKSIEFFSQGKGYELALTNQEVIVKLEKAKERKWKVSEEVVGDCERLKLPPSAFCLAPSSSKSLPSIQRQQTTSTEVFTDAGPVYPANHPATNAASTSIVTATVKMKFIGSKATASARGLDALATKSNYFTGNNPKDWHTDIANFSSVKYKNLYKGIDAIFYGNEQNVEYDFVVAPQVDARVLQLSFDGAESIRIDEQGDLILQTPAGEIRQHKPVAYQQINGERKEILCKYKLLPASFKQSAKAKRHNQKAASRQLTVGFTVGEYDKTLPLIIDPTLDFSTFLSGGIGMAFEAADVAVDADENIYVVGYNYVLPVPASPDVQAQAAPNQPGIFVAKIDSVNKQLVYLTYLTDLSPYPVFQLLAGIAVDATGNAYVTGSIASPSSFPTTQGAFQTTLQGNTNGFVTKLNPQGSTLVYSTLLGAADSANADNLPQCSQQFGNCVTSTTDIAIDTAGNAYVTGETNVRNFPTTQNAFKPIKSIDDCSSPTGNGFVVSCREAFVTKLNATGTALIYSTFLGGNGNDSGAGIKVDTSGNAYIVGTTEAKDFPTQNALNANFIGGVRDVFLSKLNATGSSLLYSTYLGGVGADTGKALDVDAQGNVYLGGETNSLDLPVTSGVLQSKPSYFPFYKTTDSGASWKPLSKSLPGNLFVDQIAVDPNDSAHIFAGTGSGIYESTDAGESWKLPLTQQIPFFVFLTFAPQNPSVVFAASFDSNRSIYRLLKSTDKGSTWNEISYLSSDTTRVQINDLQVDPTDLATLYLNNTYYSGGVSNSRILKTIDGGMTWKYIDEGLSPLVNTRLLGINPKNPALLFATAGNLFRSKNGGTTWKSTDLTDTNISAIEFNAANPDLVYAGGNKLYGSTDSGITWKQIENNLTGFGNIRVTANSLYITSSGQVFKSIDTGKTWANTSSAFGLSNVSALTIDPKNPATLYAGTQRADSDGFVMKLDSQGSAISYCTYLGGNSFDRVLSIAVDNLGSASVTGSTGSSNFPIKDAIQPKFIYSISAFVTKLNATGSAIYSTYLSGNNPVTGTGIATDKSGRVYIVGKTSSEQFPQISPVQPPAIGSISFITRITDSALAHPAPVVLSVTPDKGVSVGQTPVTIKGASFLQGATVSVGGTLTRDTVVVDANTIQTTIRGGIGGQANMVVLNPDGQVGILEKSFTFLLTPQIHQVTIENNQLVVRVFTFLNRGYGYDSGAVLLINGKEVKTDPPTSTFLTSKKALKKIQPGQTVQLQVRNGNGLLSNIFSFSRP